MSVVVKRATLLAITLGIACGDSSTGSGVLVASMRIMSAPTSVVAGEAFGVTVELYGEDGTLATSASNEVTLALADEEITLDGVTSVNSVAGVATFTNLSITAAGAGNQLLAEAAGVSAGTAAFVVRPGELAPSQTSVSPPPGNVPPTTETFLTFTFKDAFGNAVPGGMSVALSSNLAGATFVPAAGATSSTGTFETKFRPNSAGSVAITATVDDTPITIATPYVSVELCPAPVPMAFPGLITGTQPCGAYVATSFAPSWFSFTTPGGGVSFAVTAAFDPILDILATPDAKSVAFVFDGPNATLDWLLPTGTYLFRLMRASGSGSFSLTGSAVTGNSPGVDRILVSPGEYTGQALSAGDAGLGNGAFADAYYFISPEPCQITVKSSVINPSLIVADAVTGVRLVPDRSTFAGNDALSGLIACHGGQNNPVLILATSMNPGELGAYSVKVQLVPPPTPGAAQRASSDSSEELKPVRLRRADLAKIVAGFRRPER